MQILINHLTRMHGGRICVAGVDPQTRRHVRPVLEHGGTPATLLARYGGPFEMARVVELGTLRPAPDPPHVEDHVLVPSWARPLREADPDEFWNLLHYHARTRLCDIFGEALHPVGHRRLGTDLGRGDSSLGCLLPQAPPGLYLAPGRRGKRQVRIEFSDGHLQADAAVTDLRLCEDDHATPDEDKVRGVAKWIRDSAGVVLSVGLTRKFRSAEDQPYIHWLQVNNIHLKEDPAWRLG